MDNTTIARILGDYADLLELKEKNRFRIASYRRAAEMVQSCQQPIAGLLERGENITQIAGIGTSMAEHIKEIVATGRLQALTDLREEFPGTISDLLKLEGLGPKRVKRLHEDLGVNSLEELTTAIDAGRVQRLPGFAKKSVDKIRSAIGRFAKRPGRIKLADAEHMVGPLTEYLRAGGDVERLEVAGSYRRRMETVGDIDILITGKRPARVMQRFQSYPEVERVLGAGSTRGTVILRSGLQVDLRIVSRESYGAALCYFTGAKAHNVAVRTLGVERKFRINEYGVFRVNSKHKTKDNEGTKGERIGGAEEQEVYGAVGLDWVPPELREDRGEIEAAAKHELPKLISPEDIRGDLHMHSQWTDGRDTIEEMLGACKESGYQYCAITDHSQAARIAGGLKTNEFHKQLKEIEKVRSKFRGITLLAGCEVDILADGTLDLPNDILHEFDIVVASVHSSMNMTAREMTQRVLRAIAHPAVTILAHPTGRQIGQRAPFGIDLEKVFHAAKENNVAVELNAQPLRLDLNDVHVRRAGEIGVKVAINSDAHSAGQLSFMRYGIDQARRGWLEKKHVINTLPWAQFHKWLKQRGQKRLKAAAG